MSSAIRSAQNCVFPLLTPTSSDRSQLAFAREKAKVDQVAVMRTNLHPLASPPYQYQPGCEGGKGHWMRKINESETENSAKAEDMIAAVFASQIGFRSKRTY